MKTRQVAMHYCEFCKRKAMRRAAMEKHEKHCGMNPNRACRMCDLVDGNHAPMATLLALIPAPMPTEYGGLCLDGEQIEASLAALRTASGNCPACILAALRQAAVVGMFSGKFSYQAEAQSIFAKLSQEQQLDECY